MNPYLVAGIPILIILLTVPGVSAHPPADLNLSYNLTSGNLSATFTHPVSNPATHYVVNVKISLDGNETPIREYSSQPEKDLFTYEYPLNVTAGTDIAVSGECNIFGTITRSITA
jgi:hypothetical protein